MTGIPSIEQHNHRGFEKSCSPWTFRNPAHQMVHTKLGGNEPHLAGNVTCMMELYKGGGTASLSRLSEIYSRWWKVCDPLDWFCRIRNCSTEILVNIA